MVCDAVQNNQIKSAGGNSGSRPFCIATLAGSFIGNQTMKTCYKCKESKQLSMFSKNRNTKDGYCNRCKSCVSAYHKNYTPSEQSKANKAKYLKSERGRSVQLAASTRYSKTEKGKSHRRKCSALFRRRHPMRIKATSAVNYAVITGKIPAPSSFVCDCGNRAEQYHHDKGYAKENWLVVLAKCTSCHAKLHRNK